MNSDSHPVFEARAPARIDLAGGTVDIFPICQIEPRAATVNLAIDRYATARVRLRDDDRYVFAATDRDQRERYQGIDAVRVSRALPLLRELAVHASPDRGIELTTMSGVPVGSGLGGSSTLAVAALAALAAARGLHLDPDELLRRAINVETRVIAVPTGAQDYMSAIHGGLGVIRYPVEGPRRTPIAADLQAVEDRLVLVYTGKPHFSGTNNWEITKAYVDGDGDVRRLMRDISMAAGDLAERLGEGDLDDGASEAIGREWAARKLLAPGVTTAAIEELGDVARAGGATAMKVCGAGGGGCVFFWCAGGRKAEVSSALEAHGAEVLAFHAAPDGVR
jgi:D-glycero-alpha-D-manno-heptose-7-phosphate kinase